MKTKKQKKRRQNIRRKKYFDDISNNSITSKESNPTAKKSSLGEWLKEQKEEVGEFNEWLERKVEPFDEWLGENLFDKIRNLFSKEDKETPAETNTSPELTLSTTRSETVEYKVKE